MGSSNNSSCKAEPAIAWKLRNAWVECEPPWIPLVTNLVELGPQESFSMVIRMRESAIKSAVSLRVNGSTSAENFSTRSWQAAAMLCIASDLENILQARCQPPWSAVLPVSWSLGPSELLSYLLEKEKVLDDTSWDSLRIRCSEGRRVYTFVHCSMPLQPLAFTSVALCIAPATSLVDLVYGKSLVTEDPQLATTAVFYSINSPHQGLSGLNIGRQLLHRTVYALATDFPHVQTFMTLSPIPGFLKWLRRHIANEAPDSPGVSENLPFRQMVLERIFLTESDRKSGLSWTAALTRALEDPEKLMSPGGNGDALRLLLTRLAVKYLLSRTPNKRKTPPARDCQHPSRLPTDDAMTEGSVAPTPTAGRWTEHGEPGALAPNLRLLDPVAHFHFGNGAMLHSIQWRANCSSRALGESLGMMAVYEYVPQHIQQYMHGYAATCSTPVHFSIARQLPDSKRVRFS